MFLYGIDCHETVHVIPYNVNIMSLDALRFQQYHKLVKVYIEWYLASTNDSDIFGLTGTIYDLNVKTDGSEN